MLAWKQRQPPNAVSAQVKRPSRRAPGLSPDHQRYNGRKRVAHYRRHPGWRAYPEQLASLCSTRIKASRQTVAKALHGNWDQALLFCLKTAMEIYRFTQNKIRDCDKCDERQLAAFEIRTALPNATGNLRMQLQ